MTCCVTKATPIHFIYNKYHKYNETKGKSPKTCLMITRGLYYATAFYKCPQSKHTHGHIPMSRTKAIFKFALKWLKIIFMLFFLLIVCMQPGYPSLTLNTICHLIDIFLDETLLMCIKLFLSSFS